MVPSRQALLSPKAAWGRMLCYARCETCSTGIRENSEHKPANANSLIDSERGLFDSPEEGDASVLPPNIRFQVF